MERLTPVDLSDYDAFSSKWGTNVYALQWFNVLRYRETKFVIYGQGKWHGHIMDWAGCNLQHGRLPSSPVFNTEDEALAWLKFQVKNGVYTEGMYLKGHHSGENSCTKGCDDRETQTVHFRNLTD